MSLAQSCMHTHSTSGYASQHFSIRLMHWVLDRVEIIFNLALLISPFFNRRVTMGCCFRLTDSCFALSSNFNIQDHSSLSDLIQSDHQSWAMRPTRTHSRPLGTLWPARPQLTYHCDSICKRKKTGSEFDWLIGASLSSYHEKASVRYILDESAPA